MFSIKSSKLCEDVILESLFLQGVRLGLSLAYLGQSASCRQVRSLNVARHHPLKSSSSHFLSGQSTRQILVICKSKLRVLSDSRALEIKDVGDQAAQQRDTGKQRTCSLVPQSVIHLLGEKNHAGTPEASNASLGSQRAGRLVLVRVDEVVVGRVVKEDKAETHGESSHHRSPVRQMRVRRPSEDEQTDWNEPAREHHGDESRLGGWFSVGVSRANAEVVLVDERRTARGHDDADGQRDEHETGAAFGPALALDVDDRVGHEEHVQKTVKNGHVQTDQEDDRFKEQELKRADEEDAELFTEWSLVDILFGHVSLVAGFFAEFLCTLVEDGWSIGLRDGEGENDPADPREDQLDVVEPAPSRGVSKEATRQRTDGRTDKGRCAEHGHGNTTLFVFPKICQCAANKGHGSRKGDTINKPTDEECANVLCDSAGDLENNGHRDSDDVDRLSAE